MSVCAGFGDGYGYAERAEAGRTLSAGNVIHEQATRSTAVVRPSDGPKRLRAGGIPTYAGAVSTEVAAEHRTALARQPEVKAARTLELDHFVLLRYRDEFRAKLDP